MHILQKENNMKSSAIVLQFAGTGCSLNDVDVILHVLNVHLQFVNWMGRILIYYKMASLCSCDAFTRYLLTSDRICWTVWRSSASDELLIKFVFVSSLLFLYQSISKALYTQTISLPASVLLFPPHTNIVQLIWRHRYICISDCTAFCSDTVRLFILLHGISLYYNIVLVVIADFNKPLCNKKILALDHGLFEFELFWYLN